MNTSVYRVGEIAKRAGISVTTLHYYERLDLISPEQRSASGYRLYSQQDASRLDFIIQAKRVGFSLTEIKQLLGFGERPQAHSCDDVKQVTGAKIADLEVKIKELQSMRSALERLYQACEGGPSSVVNCNIMHHLQTGNEPIAEQNTEREPDASTDY